MVGRPFIELFLSRLQKRKETIIFVVLRRAEAYSEIYFFIGEGDGGLETKSNFRGNFVAIPRLQEGPNFENKFILPISPNFYPFPPFFLPYPPPSPLRNPFVHKSVGGGEKYVLPLLPEYAPDDEYSHKCLNLCASLHCKCRAGYLREAAKKVLILVAMAIKALPPSRA